MPFDKKLACLTNYQERRSFPWPLVYYNGSLCSIAHKYDHTRLEFNADLKVKPHIQKNFESTISNDY